MKIEVIVCDRCGGDVGQVGKKVQVVNLRIQRKDEVNVRELCTSCGAELMKFIAGTTKVREKLTERLDEALMEQLQSVRETAAHGLERYAEGASPDELAQHLRDVSSGARR